MLCSLNARSLNALRYQRRAGVLPTTARADEWASGSERTAHIIGPFVVKCETTYEHQFFPQPRLRRAPTVRVKTNTGVYEIRRYCEPVRGHQTGRHSPEWLRLQAALYMDLHAGHGGTDRHGRFVAFDW